MRTIRIVSLLAAAVVTVLAFAQLTALRADPAPLTPRATEEAAQEVAFTMSTNPLVANDMGLAPELNNTIWINSDKPLKLADLKGKVVLIEFWTFECINCQHTLPAMNSFYDKYADKGLVIIGDHFPEFSMSGTWTMYGRPSRTMGSSTPWQSTTTARRGTPTIKCTGRPCI